jgi:uncharacterized protein YjbI with pentapeptide repeats
VRGSSLFRVNLHRANLSGADLTYADMRDTNLQGAILANTRLPKALLTGTNINAANNLRQAEAERANLRGTILGPLVCVLTNYPNCTVNLESLER